MLQWLERLLRLMLALPATGCPAHPLLKVDVPSLSYVSPAIRVIQSRRLGTAICEHIGHLTCGSCVLRQTTRPSYPGFGRCSKTLRVCAPSGQGFLVKVNHSTVTSRNSGNYACRQRHETAKDNSWMKLFGDTFSRLHCWSCGTPMQTRCFFFFEPYRVR